MRKEYSFERRLLPKLLWNDNFELLYPSSSDGLTLYYKIVFFYGMVFLFALVLGFYFGKYLFSRSEFIAKSLTFGSIGLSIIVFALLFKDWDVYLNGMLLTVLLLASSMGLSWGFIVENKRTKGLIK